jgi:type IV secretion system protein VirB4
MPFGSTIGHTDPRGWLAGKVETGWELVVPDVHHIDEWTVLLSDGSLLAVVEHPGHQFQLEEMIARNTSRGQHKQLWQNISDSNVTVSTHLVHRRMDAAPIAGTFTSDFGRNLFAAYRRNCLVGNIYANTWFLTVLVSPRFVPAQAMRRMLKTKTDATAGDSAVRQLEDIMQAIMAYAAPSGARRLGYRHDEHGVRYSEIAEARRMCLYCRWAPVPVLDGPLGAAIYNERIVCGSRAIRIEGFDGPRYAKGIAFGRYPSVTRTGQLAHVLNLKCEFVLAQSMRFESRSASETSIYFRQTHMVNAMGVQAKAIAALDEAAEDVQSGEVVRGKHNLLLIVHAPDIPALNTASGAGADAINKAGGSPITDDLNAFAGFWATYTGNQEWMQARSGDIRTDNFSALAEFNAYPAGGSRGPWGRSLVQFKTSADTVFDWQPHVGLLAHTLFLGLSRSGKTLLMNLLLTALEQVGARVFYFDRDHCAEPMIRAAEGIYLALRSGEPSGLAPLRGLSDTASDREFLVQWIGALIRLDGRGELKPETAKRLKRGVARAMKLPAGIRTLGAVRSFLGYEAGGDGERLDIWCHDGANGWLFDGEADEVRTDARMVGFDMTKLLAHYACPAVAAYLLHRIRPRIDGTPVVVACPEARFYLLSPLFASIIEDFALGLAKKNGALWLDTQEPQHLLDAPVGASLVSQCSSIFQYPTRTAKREVYLDKLGFSPAMFKAITEEMPVLPFRSVLLRRENESVILNVELTGMADDVAVLSGTETTIRLIPDVLAAIGNNRGAFRDEFVRRVNAAKENK